MSYQNHYPIKTVKSIFKKNKARQETSLRDRMQTEIVDDKTCSEASSRNLGLDTDW